MAESPLPFNVTSQLRVLALSLACTKIELETASLLYVFPTMSREKSKSMANEKHSSTCSGALEN